MVQHTIPTTFNSQNNIFNEILLFQHSPVQPLTLLSPSAIVPVAASYYLGVMRPLLMLKALFLTLPLK